MLKFGIVKSWNGKIGKVVPVGETRSYTFRLMDIDSKLPENATTTGTRVDFQTDGFEAKVIRPTYESWPFEKLTPKPDYRWAADNRARSRYLACSGELYCAFSDLDDRPTL